MNDWHQMLQRLSGQQAKGKSRFVTLRSTALRSLARTAAVLLIAATALTGCSGSGGDRIIPGGPNSLIGIPKTLQEVSTPGVIQALKQELDVRPQLSITSPKQDEVIEDDRVTVRFQVSDFPAFKDEALAMGPHLHVILDNEPYRAVYDPSQPLVLEDLEPGTHTLRAFASRPWHESFKNAEAYAQTQFYVFTQTPDSPDLGAPMLTYSRPKGGYGAEPILLDFYLQNAPLHLVAQEDGADEVSDWKIRCTINGQVFTFDTWEPLYLTGFKPGKNWIQLELLDENDTPISNSYNNTARLITLEPGGDDTLSKLVRGELSLQDARSIIIAGYEPPVGALETESVEPIEPEPLLAPVKTPAVETSKSNRPAAALGAKAIDSTPEAVPEPVSLPKTEAFPPGILMEETLPERLPALEPEVEPSSKTAPDLIPTAASPTIKSPAEASDPNLGESAQSAPPRLASPDSISGSPKSFSPETLPEISEE